MQLATPKLSVAVQVIIAVLMVTDAVTSEITGASVSPCPVDPV